MQLINRLLPFLLVLGLPIAGCSSDPAAANRAAIERVLARPDIEPELAYELKRLRWTEDLPEEPVLHLRVWADDRAAQDPRFPPLSGQVEPGRYSARATPLELESLLGVPGVREVLPYGRGMPALNTSVPEVGADQVHPTWDGTGVVVGIVDTGIDLSRADFQDSMGNTRVAYLWDRYGDGGGLPSPTWVDQQPTQVGGYECTASDIDDGTCPHTDTDGHGSHVAGIAAANGSANSNIVGVAPGADLVVVDAQSASGGFEWDDVLAGIDYIRARATEMSQPYVINLSLGGSAIDSHSGCSANDVDFGTRVADGSPLVIAMGNDGARGGHTTHTYSPSETHTFELEVGANRTVVTMGFWYGTADRFSAVVCDPSADCTTSILPGDPLSTETLGPVTVQTWSQLGLTTCPSETANQILIQLDGAGIPTGTWTIELTAYSASLPDGGTVHGWVTQPDYNTFAASDPTHTIATPATTPAAISVGSYATKDPWDALYPECWSNCDVDGDINDISTFSNRGPLLDAAGTIKPEIAAPGEWIRSMAGDGWWWSLYHRAGTSMSAPHVAGSAALMLQKNPDLTPAQIKSYLQASARTDSYTSTTPDGTWGWGKLDVAAAVDLVPIGVGDPDHLECSLSPTTVLADGAAEAELTVSVVDASGQTVDDDSTISVSIISGGASASLVSAPSTDAFAGAATFTAQATTTAGTAVFEASGPSLGTCTASLQIIAQGGPTQVCGTLSIDTTWDLTGSPWELTCDVTVPAGVTLTIEPGVTVQPGASDDIYVDGALWAVGTPSSPITFASTTALPSYWGGVYFRNGADGYNSAVQHGVFRYGGKESYSEDYPLRIHPYAMPALSDLVFEDNRINGVALNGGGFASSFAIDSPEVPILVTGDITMTSTATLTIVPGAWIKMGAATDIVVEGGLVAEGTGLDPIIFTSYRDDDHWGDMDGAGPTVGVTGDWGGIAFRSSADPARTKLEHVELHFGGADSYAEDYPIRTSGYAQPSLWEVDLISCAPNAVGLEGYTYLSDFELLPIGDLAYWPIGDITVDGGATLTIHPGVGLKMPQAADVLVYGSLQAQGTEWEPIVVTSWRDDSLFGDSDGGGPSTGVTEDWGGISFLEGSDSNSVLSQVELRYGGRDSYSEDFPIRLHPETAPLIEDIGFVDCSPNAIGLEGGTWLADLLIRSSDGIPYWPIGDFTVGSSATLTIEPGTHFKVGGTDFLIHGNLIAEAPGNPIVFTSYRDDSRWGDTNNDGASSGVPADWGSLAFYSTSDGAITRLVGVETWYAGKDSYSEDWAMVFDGTDPLVQDCVVGDSDGGIYISGGGNPDLGGGARGSTGGNLFLGFVPSTPDYSIRNNTAGDIYALDNAWDVTDIAGVIHDQADDPTRGEVHYGTPQTWCTPSDVQACGIDTGECVAGTRTCDAWGMWGPCTGEVAAVEETCNGLDDDCDGSTDEALERACGTDVGECIEGTQTCSAGNWGPCSGAIAPAAEVCDALDNDCDGAADESLVQTCGSDVGECSTGERTCYEGAWSDCAGDVGPSPEVCDSLDNDCDGTADDGAPCPGGPTSKCGTLASQTWTQSGSPYVLTCDVTVPAGSLLTIEAGVQVLAQGSTDIEVYGALWAEGSASDPIVFEGTAAYPGFWGGIYFDQSSIDSASGLQHVVIRHGGKESYAIDYPLRLDARANPTLSDLVFEDNRINGIAVEGGGYTSGIQLDTPGIPYYLTSDLTIGPAAVLTISPGVLLKLPGAVDILVEGGLIAAGTELEPIVFTSAEDDTRGGDTNGDGPTLGQPGNWGGIYFQSSTLDQYAQLQHVELRYGGADSYAEDYPIRLSGYANPTFQDVLIEDCSPNAIGLNTGGYTASFQINEADGLAYWFGGDVTVGPAATLTIEPGTLIKMGGAADLIVQGALVAAGTPSAQILFTSYRDDTAGGDADGNGPTVGVSTDWGGIELTETSSSATVIEHVELRYGGRDSYGADYPIRLDPRANPSLSDITLTDCSPNAIGLEGGGYTSDLYIAASDGLTHWLTGDLTIAASATLTVEAGTLFKLTGATDLLVEGDMVADGATAPIVFTSWRDDSFWGDSNNDGGSVGDRADWGGITFYSTSNGGVSLLRGVELHYGGADSYASDYALVFDGADPVVEDSLVQDSEGAVWVLAGGSPDLGGGLRGGAGGNHFIDNTSWVVRNDASNDVFARYNYWGTDDPAVIGGGILDQLDDPARGLVHWDNYLECLDGMVQECGSDVGECQSGTQTCEPTGFWGVCVGEVGPVAEVCDGLDNDCDGSVPADEADADGDGVRACDGDCDDADPTRYPGAVELCNGVDDDCDGIVPAQEADADADGFRLCAGDCDDTSAAIFPGAPELCDGLDGDCDGALPANEADADADGNMVCAGDCDDGDPTSWSGAPELCDGIDNDCDGVLPASESDSDGDGEMVCEDDCDDSEPTVYSGAPELCDGLDNDCDGAVPSDELDGDADGQRQCAGDCDDADQNIYDGAPELCDGWDNDCDGGLGPAEIDADGDFFFVCTYVLSGGNPLFSGSDCDDSAPLTYPGAPETCDGVDNDCDGTIADEGDDADGDGVNTCTDCDDADANVYPSAPEICDGADNDCDGIVPADEQDGDADGFIACTLDPQANPGPSILGGEDCAPADGDVYPGAPEQCNGADDDCDGGLPGDEADTDSDGWMECAGDCDDADGNSYPTAAELCDGVDNDCNGAIPPDEADDDADGVRVCAGDCDDASAAVFPGAPEQCNGVDDDCDGAIPPDEADGDSDSWRPCDGDCDDTDAAFAPGAPELCDGLDNDCDSGLPADETDGDGDGWMACAGDCDDADATISPVAAEQCNGVDDDCDGTVPDDEADDDADGVRVCAGDCDDSAASTYPSAPEVCDAVDNDCDGLLPADEQDADGDGEQPCAGDCDDATPDVYTGAPELCDGLDNDCNGFADVDFAGEVDADVDGALSCLDCDDADGNNYPGNTESCDGLDNDCSGAPDADVAGEVDADGDGTLSCADCDDADATAWPGAPELCDGVDNDCDGSPGADAAGEVDADADAVLSCLDCDDDDGSNFPGNVEVCDGQDNDCDGVAENVADADGDGQTVCDGDCDDASPTVWEGAPEVCNGVDDDCSGAPDADAAGEVDVDSDGSLSCEDCDDAEAARFPGSPEVCDGLDNDCDGVAGADAAGELDADADSSLSCEDCDDGDPANLPGGTEVCDGADNDCSGAPDADAAGEVDGDGDGALSCDDCDDAEAARFPGNPEVCDGLDNDCSGAADLNGQPEEDADNDGWLGCAECDDGAADRFPGNPEVCDGIDNDCDADTNDVTDVDSDGFSLCDGDCDDNEPAVHPDAEEVCNGLDDDCDPLTDEDADQDGDSQSLCDGDCDDNDDDTWFGADELCNGEDDDCDGLTPTDELDEDGDGQSPCEGDCDDSDPDAWDGAPELCDGLDNDCDGEGSDELVDTDGDGLSPCEGDCDDTDPATFIGASEVCDGSDNDCDGLLPDHEVDADGDGQPACAGDCDESDPTIFTGADELCDGLDNDCDDAVPADEVDADADGFAPCDGDCDDLDPDSSPGFTTEDACEDGADNDCDGATDQEDDDCPEPGEPPPVQDDPDCSCAEEDGPDAAALGLFLLVGSSLPWRRRRRPDRQLGRPSKR